MAYSTEKQGKVAIVSFSGPRLDAGNVAGFRSEIPALLSGDRILFDLQHLSFVDSSGLGAILSCVRQVNARGGELRICNVSRTVMTLFELVRFHKVVDLHGSRAEALAAFGA